MTESSKSIWRVEVLPEIFIIRWARRFIHWLFSRRGLRGMLIALAWMVTFVALFYGEENWRGRRGWNECRKALAARGERLDFKEFIPPTVPDDQNFAATPFFKFAFEHRTNTYLFNTDPYGRVANTIVKYDEERPQRNRGFRDLAAWAMGFEAARSGGLDPNQRFQTDQSDPAARAAAAASVLEGLKADEEVFAEFRQASSRPHSRYAIEYTLDDPWGILVPHLERLVNACRRLELKACAELAAGQSEPAFADVKLILFLADSIQGEPTIVSYLVRRSCVSLAAQPVWEGLAERRWSGSQLQELQARFQKFDLIKELKASLEVERAAALLTADLLAEKKYRLDQLSGDSSWLVGSAAPRGWYSQEKLSYCRLYQTQWEGAFDPNQRTISPGRVDSNGRRVQDTLSKDDAFGPVLRHEVLARLLLPASDGIAKRAARGQVTADQAALGCALERYRLANGHFPETLDALVPGFMAQVPHDAINGGPYKYRRTDDGQFILYSVGWNEKDDGGTVSLTTKQRTVDWVQGDWVWRYPSK